MLRIVADSSCDLTQKEAQELGITVMPLGVRFNNDEYQDGIDMDADRFYDLLEKSDVLPKTIAINAFTYEEQFRALMVNEDDQVLCITIGSKLSSSYQNACRAAEQFNGRVTVIDSETTCIPYQVIVRQAARLNKMGTDPHALITSLQVDVKRARLVAMLDTLEYLRKGGRISAVAAAAGKILGYKPVITIENGKVDVVGKARGLHSAGALMVKYIEEHNGIDFSMPVSTSYSGHSDYNLQNWIKSHGDILEGHEAEIHESQMGSVVGTHCGPGVVGIAYFSKNEK
ncbi:MAG: DegV family protein [Bulleidia sp.]|nr:DegV family protein [Bulleidia sp.]